MVACRPNPHLFEGKWYAQPNLFKQAAWTLRFPARCKCEKKYAWPNVRTLLDSKASFCTCEHVNAHDAEHIAQ